MPRCVVSNCDGSGVHRIPKDEKMCQLWLKAIRRKNFIPTKDTRLCRKHFLESDYQKVSIYTGVEHQHKYLKKGTVPSVFSWDTQPLSKKAKAREKRLEAHSRKITQLVDGPSTSQCCEDAVTDEEDDDVYLIVSQHDAEFEINFDFPKNNLLSCGTSNRLLSTEQDIT
ncbi:THAP domain-containing protein 4-like [Spodoptera litura]|uniref:THAP domain-containing protein 4-like n=1 Tax=Spodoptera litura TaxID=69820 RepID=A0A9J7EGH8_SPOLT|nr:THAP domain-containing protein 4-like [Spodoptera litura]